MILKRILWHVLITNRDGIKSKLLKKKSSP